MWFSKKSSIDNLTYTVTYHPNHRSYSLCMSLYVYHMYNLWASQCPPHNFTSPVISYITVAKKKRRDATPPCIRSGLEHPNDAEIQIVALGPAATHREGRRTVWARSSPKWRCQLPNPAACKPPTWGRYQQHFPWCKVIKEVLKENDQILI